MIVPIGLSFPVSLLSFLIFAAVFFSLIIRANRRNWITCLAACMQTHFSICLDLTSSSWTFPKNTLNWHEGLENNNGCNEEFSLLAKKLLQSLSLLHWTSIRVLITIFRASYPWWYQRSSGDQASAMSNRSRVCVGKSILSLHNERTSESDDGFDFSSRTFLSLLRSSILIIRRPSRQSTAHPVSWTNDTCIDFLVHVNVNWSLLSAIVQWQQ